MKWKKKKEKKQELILPTESYFDKKYYRIIETLYIDGDSESHVYSPQFNKDALKDDQKVDHRGSVFNETNWVNLSDNNCFTIEEAKQVCYKLRPKKYKFEKKTHQL